MGSVATLEAAGGLGTLKMPTEVQDHRCPSNEGGGLPRGDSGPRPWRGVSHPLLWPLGHQGPLIQPRRSGKWPPSEFYLVESPVGRDG